MTFYGLKLGDIDGGNIASIIFLIFLLLIGVLTIIMVWHWRKYGFNTKEVVLAEVIYFTGLAILLGGSFLELSILTS